MPDKRRKTTGRPTLSLARKERLKLVVESLIAEKYEGNAAALARAIGVSSPSLSMTRRYGGASLDTVMSLCGLAGVSPSEFLDIPIDGVRVYVERLTRYPNGTRAALEFTGANAPPEAAEAVENVMGAMKMESDLPFRAWLDAYQEEIDRLRHAAKAPLAAASAAAEKADRDAAKVDEAIANAPVFGQEPDAADANALRPKVSVKRIGGGSGST